MSESLLEQKYDYYAFISYSHKDRREVLRLHDLLEHYRLPNNIRRENRSLPKRLAPIFVDRHYLAGTQLTEKLQQELRKSRYLIVACSPNSAKSGYVNDEVAYFISLGRQDRIIPYIVDGVPNCGDPERECYPEALRELNPLGADAHDLGKSNARLRLIATMLDVNLDVLVRKERQRAIRRAAMAAAAMVLAAVPAVYYFVPFHTYYDQYSESYGLPQGIGQKLSIADRREREASYRITTKAGKVISLAYVHEDDALAKTDVSVKTEVPLREYRYTENGQLQTVILKDRDGIEEVRWEYTNNLTEVNLRTPGGDLANVDALNAMLGADAAESGKNNGITAYKIVYDAETGRMKRRLNIPYPGSLSLIASEYGAFGFEYEYLDNGLMYRRWNLDIDGRRAPDNDGTLYTEYTYDDQFRVTDICSYASEGEPVEDSSGAARMHMVYESDGAWQLFYDLSGNLVPGYYGTEQYKSVVDDKGYLIANRYFDAGGNPRNCIDGYASVTLTLDDQHRQTERRFWGEDGEPVLLDAGYHLVTVEYQEDGTKKIDRFYDIEGNPVMTAGGYFMLTEKTDDEGRVLYDAYYDTEEAPCLNANGYHRLETTHDDQGNEISVRYFGTEHQPVMASKGYASMERTYRDGRCTFLSWFDAEGNPVSRNGGAAVEVAYNDLGLISEYRWYGADGKLYDAENGYAILRVRYDGKGNCTDYFYYDAAGSPTTQNEVHHYRVSFNDQGKIVSMEYLNADGERTLHRGVARTEREYDDRGRMKSERYYGINLEPTEDEDGIWHWEQEHNRYGDRTRVTYYGLDGRMKPISSNGAVNMLYIYDDRTLIRSEVWTLDGDVVKRSVRDERLGLITEYAYFDLDGNPAEVGGVHRQEYRNDADGGLIGGAAYTATGNLAPIQGLTSQNIAMFEDVYDAEGEKTLYALWVFQENGLILRSTENIITGNLVETAWFNPDKTPAEVAGIHRVTYDYDEAGRQICLTRCNADGLLAPDNNGIVRRQDTYDETGVNIITAFWSLEDDTVLREEIDWRINQLVSMALYSPADEPIEVDGLHSCIYRYDESGVLQSTDYYDLSGQLVGSE